MKVLHSRLLSRFPGIQQGTATLAFQPLTFRGHAVGAVQKARKVFLHKLHIPASQLVLGRQVHGTHVQVVKKTDAGRGALQPNYLPATDALLTDRPDIALGVFTADCIPVLLHDPVTGWIGAIHAGWQGVVKGIIPKALRTLQQQGVRVKDVRVWCGPSICETCYTTTDVVRARRIAKILPSAVRVRAGLFHLDLRKTAWHQLMRAGVPSAHCEISRICTKTSRFLPSARRQGPTHPNTLSVLYREDIRTDLRGKDVVIFGLGTLGGGVASAAFAADQGAHVHVVDAQTKQHLAPSIALLRKKKIQYHLGQQNIKTLPPADVIIANPGIRPDHSALRAAKKAGARITNDLSLYRERSTNPLIAITGTKGKTTVTRWLAHILASQKPIVAGNLQLSPLAEPEAMLGKRPVLLEVSSFQLEHCDVPLAPELSIVTNLYPDHLNRHGTMRAYASVKASMLAKAKGPIILPLDSEWKKYVRKKFSQPIFWSSEKKHPQSHAWLENGWIVLRQGRRCIRVLRTNDFRGQDAATLRNAVTVALAASVYGVPLRQIRKGLCSFTGVPQRFEIVRTYRGRTFINSTTATNPISALTALRSVSGSCVILAGGSSKTLPMGEFARALQQKNVTPILFAGTASITLQRALKRKTPIVKNMRQAVRLAWKLSQPGDTILLAPGAASFGMFRNEFDRGAQFVRNVRALR